MPIETEKMRGVAEFEKDYFCGPLFLSDEKRTLYQFLGNKNIASFGTLAKALLNPFKTRKELKSMGQRLKEKGVEGNMVGDGLRKGGVLCISKDGELKHTFFEDPGNGIPMESQKQIIEAVRSF